MAEKKFMQMTTKKLEALLETASEEDKVKIMAVLEARGKVSGTPAAPATVSTELTDEEKAAIAAAEGNAPTAEDGEKKRVGRTAKKPALTEEQRKEIADKLRAGIMYHRCQVVPFNSAEWVDGTVSGIIEEKRTNKVIIAVTLDDGRRVVKNYDSELIKVLDDVVEPTKRARATRSTEPKAPWTDEAIDALKEELAVNVGKFVKYPKTGKLGEAAADGAEESGRIVSLVPNKRTQNMLYRIKVDGADGVFAHKVSDTTGLVINPEIDEEGQKIQDKFIARMHGESASTATAKTPEEVLAATQTNLAKAEAQFIKLNERIAKLKATADELIAKGVVASPTTAPTESEADDSGEATEDLM